MNHQIEVYNGKEFDKIYCNSKENLYGKEYKFKYFHPSSDFQNINEVYFFTIRVHDKIVGIAHIRKNPYIDNTFWLSYLSILENRTNMGLASKLSDYIFKWFKYNKLQFETSSYSKIGFKAKTIIQ